MVPPSFNRGMQSGKPGTASGMIVPRFRNAERNMEAVALNAKRVPTEPHGKLWVNSLGMEVIVDETKVQDDAVSVETLGMSAIVNQTYIQDDAVSVETLGMEVIAQEEYASTVVDDAVSLESLCMEVIVMETY